MAGSESGLELLALARLGLAHHLKALETGPPGADVLEALVKHGSLQPLQADLVRDYVARYALTCPACEARALAPADSSAATCPDCGVSLDRRSSGSWNASPKARPPGEGSRLGPLQLEKLLGRGANGAVFRARHGGLGREAAVKVLERRASDDKTRRRFEREIGALARLSHPGIVRVHAAFQEGDWLAFEMDLVEGDSLEQRLRGGPLPWPDAVALVAKVARAVGHAHAKGVLHRDLKPANVLLRKGDGEPLVVDFGLARFQDQASSLTAPGGWIGTPSYMAPEAFSGEGAETADVYSLGVMLYELVSGKVPFEEANPAALFWKVERGICEPLRVDGAPPGLEIVRARAMRPDPAQRYPTTVALAEDLERLLVGKEPLGAPASRRTPLVVVAVVLVGGAAGFALTRGTTPEARPAGPSAEERLQALAVAAAAPGVAGEAAFAALGSEILAAPTAALPRLMRLRAARTRGAPLDAPDLEVVLRAGRLAGPEIDALAEHALARGFRGSSAEAARLIRKARPGSSGASTLAGMLLLEAGVRDEARAAFTEARADRARRFLRAIDTADLVAKELGGMNDGALEVSFRRLARDLAMLEGAGAAVVLAPLGKPLRDTWVRGRLGDPTAISLAGAAAEALGAGRGDMPPLLVCLESVLDVSAAPGARPTSRTGRTLEERFAAARSLEREDPLLAAAAAVAAVRIEGEIAKLTAADLARVEPVLAWANDVFDRKLPSGDSTPDLGVFYHIARTGLREVAEVQLRRYNLATSESERERWAIAVLEARRRSAERTLRDKISVRYVTVDTRSLVTWAFDLGRIDNLEAAIEALPEDEAESARAEILRRTGDPALARVRLLEALSKTRPSLELVGALARVEVDLGDVAAARERLAQLRKLEVEFNGGALLSEHRVLAIETALSRRPR